MKKLTKFVFRTIGLGTVLGGAFVYLKEKGYITITKTSEDEDYDDFSCPDQEGVERTYIKVDTQAMKDKAKDVAKGVKEKAAEFAENCKDKTSSFTEKAQDAAEDAAEEIADKAEELGEKAEDAYDEAKKKAGELYDEAKKAATEAYDEAVQKAGDAAGAIAGSIEKAWYGASEQVEEFFNDEK